PELTSSSRWPSAKMGRGPKNERRGTLRAGTASGGRRRTDSHQGPEHTMKLLKQAEYMAATGFTLIRQTTFARGWVHIRDSGPLSLACSPNTDAERSKNSS